MWETKNDEPVLHGLRDIGWALWDPIGLMPTGHSWRDGGDSLPFENEYDRYLLEAHGRLERGEAEADVVEYLVRIEADYIGLGEGKAARERAVKVVRAITGMSAAI